MNVKEIIQEARFKLHDTDEAKFSDHDIMAALNEANKVYRELCEEEAPSLISRIDFGILPKDWRFIELPPNCRVEELRINGRIVSPSQYSLARVDGKPSIALADSGPNDQPYELKLKESAERLTIDSEIDTIEDFRGYFVDFVVNMLNGGGPEQQATIKDRLRTKLNSYVPGVRFVQSYY